MASQLIVDLDNLTQEKAKTFAGILLAFAGFEDGDTPEIIDPAVAFGKASAAGIIDISAPHVEIPPPPLPPASIIPPPPPPAPNAPSSIGALSGGAILSVILDSDKLPWDARIHASSKATNTDGTWRLKRNVEKALVDSVTAELRRAMAAPGPQLVPAPPPPPPPPVQNVPAPVAEVDARKHYVELVGRAAEAQGAGKISLDQINKCLSAVGVDNMPSLGHRLDLVTAAAALIDGIIAGTNA